MIDLSKLTTAELALLKMKLDDLIALIVKAEDGSTRPSPWNIQPLDLRNMRRHVKEALDERPKPGVAEIKQADIDLVKREAKDRFGVTLNDEYARGYLEMVFMLAKVGER